jgi:hypothetical protein
VVEHAVVTRALAAAVVDIRGPAVLPGVEVVDVVVLELAADVERSAGDHQTYRRLGVI